MSETKTHRLSFTFWLLFIGIGALGVWSLVTLRQAGTLYDGVLTTTRTGDGSVAKAHLPGSDVTLNIPNWTLFRTGNIWSLTSRKHPLPDNFQTQHLINTSLAHGDSGSPMQLQSTIEGPLKQLFGAAEKDGIELMISSAYRSVSDQQALYKQFVTKEGQAAADIYVAKPGTSEHHTGLAVDLSSASNACEANSDSCSLSQAGAAWLQQHAAEYGFIQRYPEGKEPQTGIAFEPWHYRYLGIPMARAVAASGLTYDEVVPQIAAGYAK